MFHFQDPVVDWTDALGHIVPGWVIKAVDQVQMLDEAKRRKGTIKTILRHWYGAQAPAGDYQGNVQRARDFFNTFVDGTFMNLAHNVDYIEEWNEYFANGMPLSERERFIAWSRAAAQVWAEEYRPLPPLRHIRLILANTAVGNDIPLETAQAAADYDALLGYHAYWPTRANTTPEGSWPWYEGRWTVMDAEFRSHGIEVDWALTEAGPVLYYGGWPEATLGPDDGWRHPDVHGGDVGRFSTGIRAFLGRWREWNRGHGDRCLNPVLFTSGCSGWGNFQLRQPELNALALNIHQWYASAEPPAPPPSTGLPRLQYPRVYNVLPDYCTEQQAMSVFAASWRRSRETVGGSYDDAGIGSLDCKVARLYGISDGQRQLYVNWYAEHYPGTVVEFWALPADRDPGESGERS